MASVILPCTGNEFLAMTDAKREKILATVLIGLEAMGLTRADLHDVTGAYMTSIRKDEPERQTAPLHTLN